MIGLGTTEKNDCNSRRQNSACLSFTLDKIKKFFFLIGVFFSKMGVCFYKIGVCFSKIGGSFENESLFLKLMMKFYFSSFF